jgi:hypothetical protein
MTEVELLEEHFSHVVYTTVEQMQHKKINIIHDEGIVDFTRTGFMFRGKTSTIHAKKIVSATIMRPPLLWKNLFTLAFLVYSILTGASVLFGYILQDMLYTHMLLLVLGIPIGIVMIWAITYGYRIFWVRACYKNIHGSDETALFIVKDPTSKLFISRKDTKTLLEVLQKHANQEQ